MARKLRFLFIVLFFVSLALHAGNESSRLIFVKDGSKINVLFLLSNIEGNTTPYLDALNQNQQLPSSAVTLSPNPTKNKRFTITLNNLKGESRVAIYNIIGVLVKKTKMTSNKMTVDLNDFSTGIYLVNVSNNRRNLVKKIVVK
ncbi:T9SS type A sorting domain-containing protein [Flavobacteriaceae bacterium S356]|uniref:T9SS type A sorting domain-containing protein n=1 Tax=Asprobacillus argus TaxID=3076534 RepID=A0ABU3LFV8_9FLAO|nr:T9SS type A sorting domain-containing protein [Flavobacteriaceae bacterium S356]